MKNEMDDLLNAVFSARRTPLSGTAKDVPTLEFPAESAPVAPTEPAIVSAKAPAAPAKKEAAIANEKPHSTGSAHGSALHTADALQKNVAEMQRALDARLAQQQTEIEALDSRAELDALRQNALDDIARIKREVATPTVQNLAAPAQTATAEAAPQPGVGGAGLEAFTGLAEVLQDTVFGQEAFLKSLIIAFKRPYVTGYTAEAARNAVLLTGPACTGKHLALATVTAFLQRARVFANGDIAWMDLALYPTPAQEKLFFQDLYSALAGAAEVVAFTHYEACHPGFLTALADLVQRGSHPLASRYVMQNGRLLEAGNALAEDTVSALSARGKYLIFLTERPLPKLADSFGAPFVSALGDVCKTAPLSQDALRSISQAQAQTLFSTAGGTLQMQLSADEAFHALAVRAAQGQDGATGLLAFWQSAAKALAQYKLTSDAAPGLSVRLCAQNDAPAADFGAGPRPLSELLPATYTGALEEVKAELDGIVGLRAVKEYVLSLEDHYQVQKRRRAAGLKTSGVSMHMIFTGNPGTGKTTIARIVSKYLKAIGVLSGGQLVEVTRADLVGKYVGHTAPLTTQVLKSALGGVLFIDEAYSLYRGKDDSFGLEAIDTLVKGMEDNRDDLVVILAGYSKEMAEFLTANSGLKSRFPNIIEFPDYTGEELLTITKLQAKGKGYALSEACAPILLAYYNTVQLARARDAGNGRLARNKLEEAILNQSKRLLRQPEADLCELLPEDFSLDDCAGAR